MRTRGDLFVFEGPDGVGKSTLSQEFAASLRARGVDVRLMSFPGRESGTLGKAIYDLHHEPDRFGVRDATPSSLQLLHIAAHLDAIERVILPALRSGTTIVLDRFWWSTKVYGLTAGVNPKTLDAMIAVESAAWGAVRPTRIFLITRGKPLRPEPKDLWTKWKELYEDLANEQRRAAPVSLVENESTLKAALVSIESELDPVGESDSTSQLGLEFSVTESKQEGPYVFSGIEPAKPTIVYDTYWRFAVERQAVFFNRLRKRSLPWTQDPILQQYKFTNAYRASDRVSQYLIKNVIYSGEQSSEEVFFRVLLFKFFNKIETWELLERALGAISYREYDYKAFDRVLTDSIEQGERIFSAAYIMPSGSSVFGTSRKHRAVLKLLQQMMDDEVPLKIAQQKSMLDAFNLLRSYPLLGDFLAYQYVTDLNYSTLTNFSEMEFVVPGPGAKGGISKCFASLGGLSEADIIRVVTNRQHEEFERLGLHFESLWGRPLQLIDCQNLFCEVDKYSRVKHPDYLGTSQRTKIKQKFRPDFTPIDYWFPPKWGLNAAVSREKKDRKR